MSRLAAGIPAVVFLTLLAKPVPAGAVCSGDCAGDLSSHPKSVERYVKKRWEAVTRCAKRGEPACPTVCPLPDGTATPFELSPSCAARLSCEGDALAELVYGDTWDGAVGCPSAVATTCGRTGGAGAGELALRRLKRRRASTLDRLPKDLARCVKRVDRGGDCGGEALCTQAGAWVDTQFPVTLAKAGYQSLAFDVAAPGEGVAVLTLAADTASWGTLGRESVVLEYDVDGSVLGTIVVYGGPQPASYRVLLGDLAAGQHRIGLRHLRRLSPASDSPVTVVQAANVEAIPPADPRWAFTRFAPVLLGIDDKLNLVGTGVSAHPPNSVSDVPLLVYARAVPGAGMTTYQYVMIWSNEDGGTGQFPSVLIAQWGRTSDIETIVEVDVTDAGALAAVRYRPDESGTLANFDGSFQGTHPVVRTATANGLIAADGASTLRFAVAPFAYDDGAVTRESAMDLDPVSYRIMGEEMVREGKTEGLANPSTAMLSDLRNYLFVDYDIDVDVSGRVLRAVAVVGGVPYASDHFLTNFNQVFNPRVARGRARTAIELPPGTTVADVEQFGLVGIGTMNGTLHGLDAFILDADYLPGSHITFSGALAAGGLNPAWLVVP